MHRSKIVRSGDAFTMELPREFLEESGFREGDEVILDHAEGGLAVIALASTDELPNGIDPEFARRVDAFIDKYRDALKSLAQR